MASEVGILPISIHGSAFHFFCNISRNSQQSNAEHVCCTPLIFSDRMIPIKSIFGLQVSAERSFNAVKYLKSYFWTTMTEERLNGLAVHACIHSDFSIDIHLIFMEVSVTQE
ncbi:hypothetical protein T06_14091 [Trichinella sp. T6]|nr:hypothetical protein T06_14091 [Trichinella sp. T6]